MSHLDEDTMFALVDGGVPPNQEPPMRAHLAGCATCREALASIETLVGDLGHEESGDVDAHVAKVMAEVAAPRPITAPAPDRKRLVAFGLAAVALAAAVLFAVTGLQDRPRGSERETMAARGGGSDRTSLVRNVGVRLYVGDSTPVALRDGDEVASDTAYAGAHNNLGSAPAHVMVFAVDSAKTIHWLYPAYLETDTDPASVLVAQSEAEQGFPTSVVLASPAPGRMRIVTLITREPHRVSEIERRSGAALEREALERDFGGAAIEHVVRVRSAP